MTNTNHPSTKDDDIDKLDEINNLLGELLKKVATWGYYKLEDPGMLEHRTKDGSAVSPKKAEAQLTAFISREIAEILGEDEPETWYNKDLVEKGNDYERRFLTEELPKRSKNTLRAKQRATAKSKGYNLEQFKEGGE